MHQSAHTRPHLLQEGLHQDEPHPRVCPEGSCPPHRPVGSPKSPLPPIPIPASYSYNSVLANKIHIPKGWGVWTRAPPDDSPRAQSSPPLLQLCFVPSGLVQPQDSQCPLAEDSQAQPLRQGAARTFTVHFTQPTKPLISLPPGSSPRQHY